MCSNTSSSGGGGGGGGCGNCGNSFWSSGVKKQQKRPRVPKRGPGVAELEKILRDQENEDRANAEGFSSSPSFMPHHSNPYNNPPPLKPHRSSPPPRPPPPVLPTPASPPSMTMTSRRMTILPPSSASLPSHVPLLAPKFDHISPTTPPAMSAFYGAGPGGGYNGGLGRNSGGSSVNGPGLVFPEQAIIPMNHSSNKSNIIEILDGSQSDSGNSSSRNLSSESNPIWANNYPPLFQRKHNNQCPPPNMIFGSSTPPSMPSSVPNGLHNYAEPPSNQSSYYNYASRALEEHKESSTQITTYLSHLSSKQGGIILVGMKRPHPMSLDNSLVPSTHFQVSPILPQLSRSHQLSTNDSHSASSFTSSNESYRDAKWASHLELSNKRFNSENNKGPNLANFPAFGAPIFPSPPIPLFQGEVPKCNVLPYQVTDQEQRSESSGSDHKPFYSFLEVKDQMGMKETTLGSNHEGCEAGNGGIDLSLKL